MAEVLSVTLFISSQRLLRCTLGGRQRTAASLSTKTRTRGTGCLTGCEAAAAHASSLQGLLEGDVLGVLQRVV